MLLEPVSLTPSGRPVLAPGEYEVFMLDKVHDHITCLIQPSTTNQSDAHGNHFTCQVDLEFDGLGGLQDQMEPAYKVVFLQRSWCPAKLVEKPHRVSSLYHICQPTSCLVHTITSFRNIQLVKMRQVPSCNIVMIYHAAAGGIRNTYKHKDCMDAATAAASSQQSIRQS
jgi:hypothetical protein